MCHFLKCKETFQKFAQKISVQEMTQNQFLKSRTKNLTTIF